MSVPAIRVRGDASAEELAALLAALRVLTQRDAAAESGYQRWRAIRLGALRAEGAAVD